MTKKNDGGPAFPIIAEGGVNSGLHPEFHSGMSLRDYFAAAASSNRWLFGESPTRIAEWSYAIADAMLAERSKSADVGRDDKS